MPKLKIQKETKYYPAISLIVALLALAEHLWQNSMDALRLLSV